MFLTAEGLIFIVFAFLNQFGIGLSVFTFFENSSEVHLGGWWATLAPTLAVVCEIIAKSK